MHICLYVLLTIGLVIPEPCYSHRSNNTLSRVVNSVLGILGLDDSPTERDQREEGADENLFLSRILQDPNLRGTADNCEERKTAHCDPNSPYRTLDGTCNNLQHPRWGSMRDCLGRILPASYEGHSGLRRAVDGDLLPHPRDLSLNIFTHHQKPSTQVTFFFSAFGQIMAHDQAFSTPTVGDDVMIDNGFDCCSEEQIQNPECSSIMIKKDDPFYSKFNVTCLNFLRGIICNACKNNGKRQISNHVSAAIDVSIAYGRYKSETDALRTNDGTGKLKTRNTALGEFLPESTDPKTTFCPAKQLVNCFKSGDPRANQHTYLASLQTILVREHNRMVTQLKLINPHWNEEQLFQTGRKILGAKFQNIVFKEYLPILLGKEYMDKFKLSVKREGETTEYDSTLRFGPWVEFTTGIFRIHSMISTDMGFRTNKFREMFSNNHPILEGNISEVIDSSCRVPSNHFSHFQATDLTNFLYKQPQGEFGLDMVAIDIHRGRDHGLPPYLQVLNYCFSRDRNITEFDELRMVMSQENIEILKKNYKSAQDIDLYVGVQMEKVMEGSLLPPTSACVVGGQLYFAKFGDRFYFEHANQAPSFTKAQRESLKKSTIGRMICDNTEITALQKNLFLIHNEKNPILPCNRHLEVDLNLWKDSNEDEKE